MSPDTRFLQQTHWRPAILGLLILAGMFGLASTSGCAPGGCTTKGDTKALIGGTYAAVDHTGAPLESTQLLGKYQLLFFGFTSCPDICPSGLTNMSTALDLLGSDAAQFQPIFVSIDPARDTPTVMTEYLSNFHESFIGLTGTDEQIAHLAKTYRVYYARSSTSAPDDPYYNMDHSSIIYVMDCDGHYIKHFTHSTNAQSLAAELRAML